MTSLAALEIVDSFPKERGYPQQEKASNGELHYNLSVNSQSGSLQEDEPLDGGRTLRTQKENYYSLDNESMDDNVTMGCGRESCESSDSRENYDSEHCQRDATYSKKSYSSDVNSESDTEEEEESTNEELIMFSFYNELLLDLMSRHEIGSSVISIAVEQFERCNSHSPEVALPSEVIGYSDISYSLGYLLRYAVGHAAVVRHFMVSLLHLSPPKEVSLKLSKDILHVVFLGAGPGNDALGFLSALYGKHTQIWSLNISVVDKMIGWREILEETFDRVRRGKCGEASLVCDDVNVMETFKACDVTSDISELDEELLKADFIFMVKFLSHVPDIDKVTILENVVKRLGVDALLIYIDTPSPGRDFFKLERLTPIFQTPLKKFSFDVQETSFWQNVNKSSAEMRVYKMAF